MNLDLARLRAHRKPGTVTRVTGVAILPATTGPSPELAAFLAHGERCAWSPKTLRAYRLELLRVERVTGVPLVAADRADLERYLGWLSKRGVKPSTVNKSLVVMKSFTKWALRTDVLTVDPTRSLVQAKEAKILPVHFTPAEARALLDAARSDHDRAAFATAYYLGARASEVVGLRASDVELARGEVRLYGKGKKERRVPLPAALADLLRPLVEASTPGALLYHLTYDGLRHAFGKARQRAGLSRRLTLHKLRHGYATALLEAGVPIHEIKELLGHSSVATTERYAHGRVTDETRARIGSAL